MSCRSIASIPGCSCRGDKPIMPNHVTSPSISLPSAAARALASRSTIDRATRSARENGLPFPSIDRVGRFISYPRQSSRPQSRRAAGGTFASSKSFSSGTLAGDGFKAATLGAHVAKGGEHQPFLATP